VSGNRINVSGLSSLNYGDTVYVRITSSETDLYFEEYVDWVIVYVNCATCGDEGKLPMSSLEICPAGYTLVYTQDYLTNGNVHAATCKGCKQIGTGYSHGHSYYECSSPLCDGSKYVCSNGESYYGTHYKDCPDCDIY